MGTSVYNEGQWTKYHRAARNNKEHIDNNSLQKKYHFIVHTHVYIYIHNKADYNTQVPVLNCNNYRVIDINRTLFPYSKKFKKQVCKL